MCCITTPVRIRDGKGQARLPAVQIERNANPHPDHYRTNVLIWQEGGDGSGTNEGTLDGSPPGMVKSARWFITVLHAGGTPVCAYTSTTCIRAPQVQANGGGSSNGRTTDSGSVDRGSTPLPPAKLRPSPERGFYLMSEPRIYRIPLITRMTGMMWLTLIFSCC
jgi:hypothetical protein